MATVAFESQSTSSANTTSYAATAFTPAVDELIVVFASLAGSVATDIDATDDQGGTYTLIDVANRASDGHRQAILIRDSLVSSAVSHTVTVTCASDAATGALIHCFTVVGMSKTGAAASLQTAKEENQGAGTAAPTFGAAVNTNNPTIGGVAQASQSALTEPSGWTEGGDNVHSAPNHGYETAYRDSGFTGTTITWGSATAAAFSSLAIELDASAAGDQLTGVNLDVTPDFPVATLRARLSGVNLDITPDFPTATLRARLAGAVLDVVPDMPAATLRALLQAVTLEVTPDLPIATLQARIAGAVLDVVPDFPAGRLAKLLQGVTLDVTPDFPAATLQARVSGVTLDITPDFPPGILGNTLQGVTLDVTPDLPVATLQARVSGVTLDVVPDMPAATLRANLTGATLDVVPDLPAATLRAILTGATLDVIPDLPEGAFRAQVTGVTLDIVPDFPAGVLDAGGDQLFGVTLDVTPDFPQGSVKFVLTAVSLDIAPDMPVAHLVRGGGGVEGFVVWRYTRHPYKTKRRLPFAKSRGGHLG